MYCETCTKQYMAYEKGWKLYHYFRASLVKSTLYTIRILRLFSSYVYLFFFFFYMHHCMLIFVVTNSCATTMHGCDHMCTPTQSSYYCSCNPGYILNADQRTCSCDIGYTLSSDRVTCERVTSQPVTSEVLGVGMVIAVLLLIAICVGLFLGAYIRHGRNNKLPTK